MRLWRLLTVALLCGLLGVPALAQDGAGGPVAGSDPLQVPIRIGLLHGEHGGLLEEYEANRELIERLIAQGGALAGVS